MKLLFDFLGDNDPDAALNAKPRTDIELRKIDDDIMIQFLRNGLAEKFTIGQNEMNVIQEAVEVLGSRIGWINEFGLECLDNEIDRKHIETIKEKRKKSSLNEFKKFLGYNENNNYEIIIRYLTNLDSQINFERHFLKNGKTQKCVENLLRAGFITVDNEKYFVSDKVLEANFIEADFEKKRQEIIKEIEY
jgi:hypothetical protein